MNKHVKGSKPYIIKGIKYLSPAKCLRKTTKCLTMNCTSIVLRQVMPNGATVGDAFQLLFGKECRACLAARAA